jgi:shikimate kinase
VGRDATAPAGNGGDDDRGAGGDVGERNVVITGFMGTGKTTVGRLVAESLGYAFVDTDELIAERHGPIPEIFAARGEPAFRALERAVAGELAERSGLVVATGGGMLLDPDVAAVLAATGRVVCLVASPDEVLARVVADASGPVRPLLAAPDPRARVVELLAEREVAYRRFPQVVTDGRPPSEIAADVVALVRSDG